MPDTVFGLFLSLPDHGGALNEANMRGGGPYAYLRCLNVTGRWSTRGSTHAPLLMWPTDRRDDAEDAAATASKARTRAVQVIYRNASSSNGLGIVEAYNPMRAPALLGAIPFTEARILRTATQIAKLVSFTSAVYRVYGDPKCSESNFVETRNAVNKELHQQFGGGSVTSAVAWLTGKKGLTAYDLMLTGESSHDDAKTFAAVVAGMYLAQHLEERQRADGIHLG